MSMSEAYRFLGKPTPRKDAVEIVAGRAKYIDDMQMPRMLHGKVLRSPYPHASIVSIETMEAEKFAGVRAVLTHENVPDWMTVTPRHVRVLDRRVRFVGDGVSLGAAETEEIAKEALGLIHVAYEQLPAVYAKGKGVKSALDSY